MAFHHVANKYTAHQIASTTTIHSMLANIQAIAYSTYGHVTSHEYSLYNLEQTSVK